MRKLNLFLGLFLIIFLFNPGFISADIISLNSGGSDEVVINPDYYIEGFFSGDIIYLTPVCGNGVIETGETCDDGNTVNGDGCFENCTTESGGTTPPGEEETPGESGGGDSSIDVSPLNITLNLATNTNREQIIRIENTGNITANVTILQTNLDYMVLIPESQFEIAPGEVKEVTVIFVALNKEGSFSGKLFVGGHIIYVTLNVKSKLLLFDSNIIVLNKDYLVPQGDKLKTSVTLIPLGDKERLDVVLNYAIKDYDGRLYLTRSETVLVEEQVNFRRNFDTGILPKGKYIVSLELIYPNGVAPSSAHFEIVDAGPTTLFGKVVFYLVNAILIVLILLIIIIVTRMIKQVRINKKFEKKVRDEAAKKKPALQVLKPVKSSGEKESNVVKKEDGGTKK